VKVGDRIKIFSHDFKTYETGTVVEVLDESIKYKHDKIGGHFVVLKTQVASMECDSCGCDPCDCHWGNY